MGFLSLPEDVVEVSLTADDVTGNFKLKRALSKADINYAFMRVIEATSKMPKREVTADEEREATGITLDVVMGIPDGQLAVLEKALVGWDLTYPKGHPDHPTAVPLTAENINALTAETVDALCAELRTLNHARGADEEKNLSNGSSLSSIPEMSYPKK